MFHKLSRPIGRNNRFFIEVLINYYDELVTIATDKIQIENIMQKLA